MSQVFEGKVRRLGTSMVLIIPKEVLEDAGVKEGDLVKLSLPIPNSKRREALKKVAGIDSHAEPFLRAHTIAAPRNSFKIFLLM